MTRSATQRFGGVHTALITPMNADGSLDAASIRSLTQRQIKSGVKGIVPVGTTGESPTLSHAEHRNVIEWVCQTARDDALIIPGCGSNSTNEAIELTQYAASLPHVDAALVVTPYYNKPNQHGLFEHFRAIADCSRLPLIIYDIPSRSVIRMADETIAALHKACPNILGIKDATGEIGRVERLKRLVGPDFVQLSGNDDTYAGYLGAGGHGIISVVSNIIPHTVVDLTASFAQGHLDRFRQRRSEIASLADACFLEPSPAPTKFLLHERGKLPNPTVRAPMQPVSEETAQHLRTLSSQTATLL